MATIFMFRKERVYSLIYRVVMTQWRAKELPRLTIYYNIIGNLPRSTGHQREEH